MYREQLKTLEVPLRGLHPRNTLQREHLETLVFVY